MTVSDCRVYGADTAAGFHCPYGEPFSEEYQEDYYRMNNKVFDEIRNPARPGE